MKGFFPTEAPQTICLENFCDSSLAFFAASIISIQGWTAHLHSYFNKTKPIFCCIVGPVWGRILLGPKKKSNPLGVWKVSSWQLQKSPEKKDAEKKTDLTRLYVCNQLHTSLLHAIYDVTNPVVSRWISNAMCVHIYIYISNIKVQNGSRLCFPYIRTTVSWKVGKSQRWILFQQNLRHVKYSLWLDTPATILSMKQFSIPLRCFCFKALIIHPCRIYLNLLAMIHQTGKPMAKSLIGRRHSVTQKWRRGSADFPFQFGWFPVSSR